MNSKAFVSEMIGTFALTFIGAGAGAISGNLVAVALAHGLVVLTFAFAYGSLRGWRDRRFFVHPPTLSRG